MRKHTAAAMVATMGVYRDEQVFERAPVIADSSGDDGRGAGDDLETETEASGGGSSLTVVCAAGCGCWCWAAADT